MRRDTIYTLHTLKEMPGAMLVSTTLLLAVIAAVPARARASASNQPKHILFLMIDDLGKLVHY